MKHDIVEFISICLTYQQVKVEHQRLSGFLQYLPTAERNWKHVTIDFVTRLLGMGFAPNASWVIVDRLTKSTHFLFVETIDLVSKVVKLYV